ncbi:MAG: hypothetical protein GWN01_01440 [Nitrosopumilaceae archaeon]|nr:hypothetical protein [Nitrosopumilaceae archaeon]NIU86022.1 hypothetical protein [Nitrosopumilaceae archaeon]NIX60241.1 hypothetical protein [Nitrosopumilaceae archaeon]
MSTVRSKYEISLDHFVGETKTFTLSVKDPDTGGVLDMTNTTTYDTVDVKIIKADGTSVFTLTGTISNRSNGEVQFTVDGDTEATSANAGNHIGLIEVKNTSSKVTVKQAFNFNLIDLD